MEMPILAKSCSIIGFGSFCNDFEYDYVEGTDFVIYGLGDGETAFTSVYDTEAEKVLEISATRNNSEITVKVSDTDKKFTVSISGTGIKQTIESETTVISL